MVKCTFTVYTIVQVECGGVFRLKGQVTVASCERTKRRRATIPLRPLHRRLQQTNTRQPPFHKTRRNGQSDTITHSIRYILLHSYKTTVGA